MNLSAVPCLGSWFFLSFSRIYIYVRSRRTGKKK